MHNRFVTIWFRYLLTDWFTLRHPDLRGVPFVLAAPDHGRLVIRSANSLAAAQGIEPAMAVADARAIYPSLRVLDDKPGLSGPLLKRIAEWCIRYTPAVAIDEHDGIILDASGCAHLWGGEKEYLSHIVNRLNNLQYDVRAGMADTIGAAWAISRFADNCTVIKKGEQTSSLLSLPAAALRLEMETIERLHKLGLGQIRDFIAIPRPALRRRFGQSFIQRLDQALGHEEELIIPVHVIDPYQERLPCLEPIVTRTGIEIALQQLLETTCYRLQQEQKGLRIAIFTCYRVDGKIETIQIGTNRPTNKEQHLFKLFEFKITGIEPSTGIELFILEARNIETITPLPARLWKKNAGLADNNLAELLDRLAGKIGTHCIHRYLPDEHYWPERAVKPAFSLDEKVTTPWKTDRPRPLQLLARPERIQVTAPIPDYPPMLFRYKNKLHKIIKADGPERIEQEWWLQQGQHRDYYAVEDEEGQRYWLFRLGHYSDKTYQWFMHGFFA